MRVTLALHCVADHIATCATRRICLRSWWKEVAQRNEVRSVALALDSCPTFSSGMNRADAYILYSRKEGVLLVGRHSNRLLPASQLVQSTPLAPATIRTFYPPRPHLRSY